MRASSNQAHVESHSQAMGCFSGSCFSQHAGLPAKRNGGDGWAASVQLRGAKCNFRKITQESETAEGLQACFTAGPAREYSSGSCEHNSHEISAGESDTRPLSHDQAKRFRKMRPSKHRTRLCQHTSPAAPTGSLYGFILQHGRGILSLSTLQEGLQHFVMPGVGYIAYAMMYNGPELLNLVTPVALGDPICDPSQFPAVAKAFLQQHPKAMFMQITAPFAAVLQSLGLLVNSVGGETQLDLANYTFSGYAKRGLRSAIASAAKQGISVEEVMQAPVAAKAIAADAAVLAGSADWSDVAAEMQQVDHAWLAYRAKHAGRVWFLNRQPVFAPEPGARKLVARDRAGRLLGFIFFDAVYEGGQVAGYYANVTRMRPDAHPGVLNLLIKAFIDRVRAESELSAPTKKLSVKKSLRKKLEQQLQQHATAPTATDDTKSCSSSSGRGARFVSLGLSPLHQMDDSRFPHSRTVRKLFELSYNHGSDFYPFKPLAAAKAKHGAGLHDGKYADPAVTYKQVYLAHSNTQGAAAAVAMFDLAKLVGFWKHPAGAAAAILEQKIRKRMQKLRHSKHSKQQLLGSSSSKMIPVASAAAPAAGEPSTKSRRRGSAMGAFRRPSAAAAAEGSNKDFESFTASAADLQDALPLYSATNLSDMSSLIGTAPLASPRGAARSSSSSSSSSMSQAHRADFRRALDAMQAHACEPVLQ